MIQIVKRDGSIVDFDKNRIIHAITKAYNDINDSDIQPWYASKIADEIYEVAT